MKLILKLKKKESSESETYNFPENANKHLIFTSCANEPTTNEKISVILTNFIAIHFKPLQNYTTI